MPSTSAFQTAEGSGPARAAEVSLCASLPSWRRGCGFALQPTFQQNRLWASLARNPGGLCLELMRPSSRFVPGTPLNRTSETGQHTNVAKFGWMVWRGLNEFSNRTVEMLPPGRYLATERGMAPSASALLPCLKIFSSCSQPPGTNSSC